MSATEDDVVERLAKTHAVSPAAVAVVLKALRSGGGRMAQFSHADFGGMSQWSPGMSMVADMFKKPLSAKLDALCCDLAAPLEASQAPDGLRSGGGEVSFRSMAESSDWWPEGLGRPGAAGSQNDLRYAVFPDARRLVTNDHGSITVHDTGSHRIFGVAQAQSTDQTISFTSQDGLVRLSDLPKVAN